MADTKIAAIDPVRRNRRGTFFTRFCIAWIVLSYLVPILFGILNLLLLRTKVGALQLWLCLMPHVIFSPWALKVLTDAVSFARYQERTRFLTPYFVAAMVSSAVLMSAAAYDYYAKPQATRSEIILKVIASTIIFTAGCLVGFQKLVLDSRSGWLHTRLQPFHFRSEQEEVLEV